MASEKAKHKQPSEAFVTDVAVFICVLSVHIMCMVAVYLSSSALSCGTGDYGKEVAILIFSGLFMLFTGALMIAAYATEVPRSMPWMAGCLSWVASVIGTWLSAHGWDPTFWFWAMVGFWISVGIELIFGGWYQVCRFIAWLMSKKEEKEVKEVDMV
ncbi:Uu.00g120860.m01.CDS01 [Anthostomella pinea]|uniref:Uu.00g120860.m01.CDS01 n=1 Tax=Anthostomella pinea TaxID=933095 RepID=A0AAI8VGX7_9PEZI|nr:Uu.00g120860.m01.CDS01 [Anthostomella pinea]